ncbi:MAG: ABC transporter permease [Roseburia sp.]|nr:ABC transporter permease [Roseburia sp.]
MVIGLKDTAKLFAISVIACCAVFVCTLFLNYNIDIAGIENEITSEQAVIMYEAIVLMGKVVAAVSGGSLVITSAIMLLFHIKNYIDSHGKELGILKALGYSDGKVAKHFWVFGLSVFAGCVLGYTGAFLYLPNFYKTQNKEGLFPKLVPQFHMSLAVCLIVLPTVSFIFLSVLYAYLKMKSPVMHLLREAREGKVRVKKNETGDLPFLQDLKKGTLRSRKMLVFFVGFSAFCFSAMTQMSMSMNQLASETFSWMIISIGLILAFMTLLLSLSSVVKGNDKTIAMMKVFGYSRKECSGSLLGCYRPVSYIGFAVGTVYQYVLLKITVTFIFAEYEDMPEYGFDVPIMFISFAAFLITYEVILACYSRKIGRLSVKGIMLD